MGADQVTLGCVYTGRESNVSAACTVMVTMRKPREELFNDLITAGAKNKCMSLTRIGDCMSPGTIAAAVYAGHRFARELNEPELNGVPFRRELPLLATN